MQDRNCQQYRVFSQIVLIPDFIYIIVNITLLTSVNY